MMSFTKNCCFVLQNGFISFLPSGVRVGSLFHHLPALAAAAAKSLQSCPTLCDPIDGSPPGPRSWDSPGKNTGVGFHFLLQCVKVKSESEVAQSCLTLATPWSAAYQAPPSMGFFRKEYWSGVPLPSEIFFFFSLRYIY